MSMIVIMFLVWWAIGVAVVLYEMHLDVDVTIGWAMFALILGLCGPIWLWKTLFRLSGDIILIRRAQPGPKRSREE
jgi:membrane-associated phospholipid phosphatase